MIKFNNFIRGTSSSVYYRSLLFTHDHHQHLYTNGSNSKSYITKKQKKINNLYPDETIDKKYVDVEYSSYEIHKPVLVKEVLRALNPSPGGIYIDTTFGLGGHTRAILDSCKDCFVIAIDRDTNVFELTKDLRTKYKDRLITLQGNFSNLSTLLKDNKLDKLKISGILYDFGVSSYQIDTADRGFSYKKELEGPLDMRMNNQSSHSITASHVLNTFSEKSLRDIFFVYGEEKHTKSIAAEIIKRRVNEPFLITSQLVNVVESCMPYPAAAKTISRIFRALRMFVNDEVNEIKRGLYQGELVLQDGAPLVAISFHSIEDRLLKRFIQRGVDPEKYDTDHQHQHGDASFDPHPIYSINPVYPTPEELKWNSRSDSAILRTAIRNSNPPLPFKDI